MFLKRHKQSVTKLEEFFDDNRKPEKSIVITHGTPPEKLFNERFQGDALTPAFASNMEAFILKHQPRLWTHGHTHDSFDYNIGDTRIVCNPRGYDPNALNAEFETGLSISI